jgi:O-antigen/teichoic acid export membrane protein
MKMKQYFKNVSLLFVINFGIKPIWVFAIDRKFQLILGQEVYGLYFSMLSLIYLLNVVLDIGLHTFTTKYISEDASNFNVSFSNLIGLKAALSIAYLVLVVLLSYYFYPSQQVLFITIAISQLLFSLFQFLRTFILGLQRFKMDSLLSSLDRIFLILFGLLLLWIFGHSTTIFDFVYLQILAYALCILITLVILFWSQPRPSFNINFSQWKGIIKTAAPISLIVMLMTIYSRMEGILLGQILTSHHDSGVYAMANRIIDSGYNALYLFSLFLLPAVSLEHKLNHFSFVKKSVLFSFGIATLCCILVIFAVEYFAMPIYHILEYDCSSKSIHTIQYGIFSILGVAWMYIFGSYLTATSRYFPLILIVAFGVILNLILNLQLIPLLGAEGAAISCSATQITVGLLHLIVAFYYLYSSKP